MQQQNPHNAILALAILAATCHGAGWTEVWPSQEHQRESVRQLAECYTSAVERASALFTYPTTENALRWWRSNRWNLQVVKGIYVGMLSPPYCVTWCNTNGLSTPASAAARINESGGVNPPYFGALSGEGSAPELLFSLKMPTNYFDYTPFRCLSGVGPFTNDTSTPYPHGYTNNDTMHGGTNFPTGRSCWYTTDYGWADIPRIAAALTISLERTVTIRYSTNNNFFGYMPYGTNVTSWAVAKGGAETNFSDRPDSGVFGFFPDGIYTWGYGYNDVDYYTFEETTLWSAYAAAGKWYYSSGGGHVYGTSAVANVAEYYQFTKVKRFEIPTNGFGYGINYSNFVYDAAGLGVVETNYAFVVDTSAPYSNGVSGLWGDIAFPAWCSDPLPPTPDPWGTAYGRTFLGFVLDFTTKTPTGLRRWTFEYK